MPAVTRKHHVFSGLYFLKTYRQVKTPGSEAKKICSKASLTKSYQNHKQPEQSFLQKVKKKFSLESTTEGNCLLPNQALAILQLIKPDVLKKVC